MLSYRNSWGMVEVLKALTLLDAGRKIRRLEKTLKRLQMSGHKLNAKQLGKFKSNVDNLTALKPSVSTKYNDITRFIFNTIGKYCQIFIIYIFFLCSVDLPLVQFASTSGTGFENSRRMNWNFSPYTCQESHGRG